MENELVSELYLKRENLKDAEKELWLTEDDLKKAEDDLKEAKKYLKYFVVSLIFLIPSFWLQDFKRILSLMLGVAFFIHIILMNVGFGEVLSLLFGDKVDESKKEVEEKRKVVEEKKQELYNVLSKISGKTSPDDKAVKENVLNCREVLWKKLLEVREDLNKKGINHTGWIDDKLLKDIVLTLPMNKEEFTLLPGSNKNTYSNFGEAMIKEIKEWYWPETDKEEGLLNLIKDKYQKIMKLCKEGASLQTINNKCKTNENELLKLINTEIVDLEIEDFVPDDVYREIKQAIDEVGSSDFVSIRRQVSDAVSSNYINLVLTYEQQFKPVEENIVESKADLEFKQAAIEKEANKGIINISEEISSSEIKEEDNENKELLTQIITEFERYYDNQKEAVQINKPCFKDNYFPNIDCNIDELTEVLVDCPLIYKVNAKCFALKSWIFLGLARTVFASWDRAKFLVVEIKVRDILGVNQVNKSELLKLLNESDYFELTNNHQYVKFNGTVAEIEDTMEKLYSPYQQEERKKGDQITNKEEKKNKKVQVDPQNL